MTRNTVTALFIIILAVVSGVAPFALASPPPRIPADRLAPPIPPPPNPRLVPTPTGGVPGLPPYTLETMNNCMLSGVVCEGIRAALTQVKSLSGSKVVESQSPRLPIAPDSSVTLPPPNASADAFQDVEPAITSITAGSIDTTVSTFIK